MDRWRLITTFGASPSFNMGLDQALLETADAPPTLRFYTWSPDTLSLGYFQRFADVVDTARAGALVRRITGGGAIHHRHELTFSLCAPLHHRLFAGTIGSSYATIHRAIAVALATLGVRATLRGARPVESDRPESGMCFHHSTELDLVWDKKKGVGSAQRRKGGRVLHHGSIKLGTTPLEGSIATLDGYLERPTAEDLAPRVRDAFERELGLELSSAVPTVEERDLARRLGARYTLPDFLHRR